SLMLAGAYAQDKQTAPAAPPKPAAGDEAKPAARETPPDQKAYTDIAKITDPAKKVEAYEKFKKDFPDSPMAQAADMGVLNTLATKMPDQTAKIRATSQAMYKSAVAKDKETSKKDGATTYSREGSTAQSIANTLLNANILLKDAESWGKKSLDSMKLPLYLAEQRASYTK